MPTKVRFQACQVSTVAQGSFAQKVLLRLGKPESVLWHHLLISMFEWRLPVYTTPVDVGGRLRGDTWCGMQLSTPQFQGVLHKPRIGIVPDPFLVRAVWLRETRCTVRYKLHRTQTTIKPPTCRQGLHSFCCVPNDLCTAPCSQQQEETVDVHMQHCPCKPSDAW